MKKIIGVFAAVAMLVLLAACNPAQEMVNVTLSYGEGVESDIVPVQKGSEYTLPKASKVPEGKAFISWSSGETEYLADDKLTINEDMTFTANFVDEADKVRIGDKMYATLVEAIADAKDGDTVELLQSMEGSGIVFEDSKFSETGIKINLRGNTYTVTDPTVGSPGTETNCFQFLKGNKITFENGVISSNSANAKIMLQNYSNLILDNVVVNAGEVTQYVASNNFGSLTMKNNTTLNAENCVAFDVYYHLSSAYTDGVSVKIEDPTVVINGLVEYGMDPSGTFEDFIAKTSLIVPKGYEEKIEFNETTYPTYRYTWTDADEAGFMKAVVVTEVLE